MKTLKISLITMICLASLLTLYIGFVFLVGSGFMFAGDIDLTEEQRNAAEKWELLGSFFGFILMLVSFITLIFSNNIACRLINKKSVTELNL